MKRRVIVAGKRDANEERAKRLLREMFNALDLRPETIEAIATGESGVVDILGKRFARAMGIPYEPFPANWNVIGPAAGPLRNAAMAEWAAPDGLLIAVWDGRSRGTQDMILNAHRRGIDVKVGLL